MNKIIHLPDHIVSQIAAGEVIQRPSYVVKELVENALDAKATVIEIHIEEGGLKKMQVTDNGVGMGRDDLEICFLPHTTSKLTEDHLLGIRTLGFRGEALSSIAAVSALSIKSRTESDHAGTLVTILNGELNEISPTGTPKGTVITVHDLFHVLPARKKFLKSVPTELRHITEVIVQYGLAYPGVHFQLTHNDKTILDLPRRDTLPERIRTLLGVSTFDQLIPLSHEDSYLKVEGFIGVPQISLKDNSHQYTFVNNRSVTDKIVASAVKEAFGSLIPSASTPVFLLYLTLPYDLVDVNIHPRKEQVAFINPKLVFDGVKMAVSETLHTHNITFNLARFKNETSARVGETTSISGKLLKYTLGEAVSSIKKNNALFQYANTYIVSIRDEDLVFTDQHAASERIHFEKLLTAFKEEKAKKVTQLLKNPVPLHLSILETQLIDEHQTLLEELGFVIEPFHSGSYVVRSVPTVFSGRNIEKIIKDMLIDLEDGKGIANVDSKSQRMLAFLACRSAIMAGDVLTKEVMKVLLIDLANTPNNTTCPHGRPTSTHLTVKELHREFKR